MFDSDGDMALSRYRIGGVTFFSGAESLGYGCLAPMEPWRYPNVKFGGVTFFSRAEALGCGCLALMEQWRYPNVKFGGVTFFQS